jgi:hypothetical protein
LKACFLLILPVPVKANLFFALDLVFTFGILLYLYLLKFIFCLV